MDQYEPLQQKKVHEFQTQQQNQQMNPLFQNALAEQQLGNQQAGNLKKDREKVARNMPETLQEKKEKAGKAATPFTPEMDRQLEVIVRDKEKSSSYYQPILKLSRTLLQKDLTDEAKVDLFRQLMESMTFYLNHHAETESGSQSDRRRALCQRTIKGSMLFVAQAPPEYAIALKEGLQKLTGSERDAITNMESKELKKGFLDYLNDDGTEENPEDNPEKNS